MSSLPLGIALIIAVLFYALKGTPFEVIFQIHSLLIVCGGTVAIFLFATPNNIVKELFKSFGQLLTRDTEFTEYAPELLQLAKNKKLSHASKSPLISYAADLWAQGINPDLFIVLISQKRNEFDSSGTDSVQSLKNLAKYPPALGMAGTVMGMIGLFSELDKNKSTVGTHLAIAMTATFFGLLLSNMVISPLADRLQVKTVHRQRLSASLYKILLLINQGEPISLISEEVEDHHYAA